MSKAKCEILFYTRFSRPKGKGLSCPEPSLTKQADKAGCDINTIMKRYKNTGQLPDMIKQNPQYGDFSEVASYQDSLNTVLLANEQFAGLPAAVRKRFANDPMAFLAFASDRDNGDEMVKMGLAVARSNDLPSEGSPTSPPPESPAKGLAGSSNTKKVPPSPKSDE